MKFNQLERAVIVASAAVFLLATADGMDMTWVCPVSGPGSCSDRLTTDAQTTSAAVAIGTSRPLSEHQTALLEACRWDELVSDGQVTSSTASFPTASASRQGIPCPIAAERHLTKLTSRVGASGEDARNDTAKKLPAASCTLCGP